MTDPFREGSVGIRSPDAGMVIGCRIMFRVHRSDAVIHITHPDRLTGIAPVIEEFREGFVEETL